MSLRYEALGTVRPTGRTGSTEPLFQTMLRVTNLDRLKQYRNIGAKDYG